MDLAIGRAERAAVLHNGRVVADGIHEAMNVDPFAARIYQGTD